MVAVHLCNPPAWGSRGRSVISGCPLPRFLDAACSLAPSSFPERWPVNVLERQKGSVVPLCHTLQDTRQTVCWTSREEARIFSVITLSWCSSEKTCCLGKRSLSRAARSERQPLAGLLWDASPHSHLLLWGSLVNKTTHESRVSLWFKQWVPLVSDF